APRARRERWTGLAGAAVLAGGVLAVTTDGSPVPLLSVSARGFVVTVVGGGLPQPVPVDRIGTSLLLDLDVRVVDCSVDSQAPRAVTVAVRRGTFGPTAVRASSGAQVVRALDRLVSRTCRRPRG
ncbi:MAG: hypothetical protein JWN08_1890, partial [Frankiales bacterium]|nr:hypothetical protein [Frankiales bacterium]